MTKYVAMMRVAFGHPSLHRQVDNCWVQMLAALGTNPARLQLLIRNVRAIGLQEARDSAT
jgi:hypothetical protein